MKRRPKAKSPPKPSKRVAAFHAAPKKRPSEAKTAAAKAQSGLAVGEVDALRKQLDVSMEELTARLGLSRATLRRRKTAGRLTSGESGTVVRFARLLGHAAHALGDIEEARKWLKTPQAELGGAVPLDRAQTEPGAREVENLLDRID